MTEFEMTAEYDEQSMGEKREHFVFPNMGKDASIQKRTTVPDITGGVYIRKGLPIPDRIIINLHK